MAKYILKEGVVLQPFGESSKIDSTNLTDEIAEYLIESGKVKADEVFEPLEVAEPVLQEEVKTAKSKKDKAEKLLEIAEPVLQEEVKTN